MLRVPSIDWKVAQDNDRPAGAPTCGTFLAELGREGRLKELVGETISPQHARETPRTEGSRPHVNGR